MADPVSCFYSDDVCMYKNVKILNLFCLLS